MIASGDELVVMHLVQIHFLKHMVENNAKFTRQHTYTHTHHKEVNKDGLFETYVKYPI